MSTIISVSYFVDAVRDFIIRSFHVDTHWRTSRGVKIIFFSSLFFYLLSLMPQAAHFNMNVIKKNLERHRMNFKKVRHKKKKKNLINNRRSGKKKDDEE